MVDKEIENVTFQGNSMLYPLRCVKMEQHRISANMRDLSVTNILIGETELPPKNICYICETRCLQWGFEERSIQLSTLWHGHNWAAGGGE